MKTYKIIKGILRQQKKDIPSINKHEVLVKIYAVSLNYRDLLATEGSRSMDTRCRQNTLIGCGRGEAVKIGDGITKFKEF